MASVATVLSLPGFVNSHSHTFQRAMRGQTEGQDFWAWRELMLSEASRHTTDTIRTGYAEGYREMLACGFTVVGEFHYLGFDEALAAADAAAEAGIEIVLLHVAYARGGIDRFRQETVLEYLSQVEQLRERGLHVGVAPHSVRACPAQWLEEIGRYAAAEGLVLHIHADEQPREIEECLAEHGVRPIELLERTGCLTERTTIVHATHANDPELDLLAAAGARVCACPTTEASLGDGFVPVERLLDRGIGICIGTDSNVRIDPLEELRELEGIARRAAVARNVVPPAELLRYGTQEGGTALGLESWPEAQVNLSHRVLRDVPREHVENALLFSCSADVFVAPER
jgi:formimidoylglutamate deiminase